MSSYNSQFRGRCPYCNVVVKFEEVQFETISVFKSNIIKISSPNDYLKFYAVACPNCGKIVLSLEAHPKEGLSRLLEWESHIIWPLSHNRAVPEEVPPHIAADYKEGVTVLNLSAKASAALSRRCLQSILREAGNAKQRYLSEQIEAVKTDLPSYIAQDLDAVRHIGNFAAHPIKDKSSGEIVDVEPGEAEWNLEVLDRLFDFYYMQPALQKKRQDELNEKLEAAGKPPMK